MSDFENTSKDDSFDVLEALRGTEVETSAEVVEPVAEPEATIKGTVTDREPAEARSNARPMPSKSELEPKPNKKEKKEEKKHVSNLDKAIAAKKNQQIGIVDDEKLAADEAAGKRPAWDSDESRQEFEETLTDMDIDTKRAKSVVVIREVKSHDDYIQMLNEVTAVTFAPDGTAIVPEGAQFIIPKTQKVVEAMNKLHEEEKAAEENKDKKDASNASAESPSEVEDTRQAYKNNVVRIIIDKTGLGANINFDDEENKIIERANVIELHEVEAQELRTINIEKIDNTIPFMQAVSALQPSMAKAPMTFPNSGFKASMSGLSWGQYADIALDPEYNPDEGTTDILNFDKLYKRYSIIYNNMVDISVGPFKDFEDFLKKFAYDDTQMALYGLLIASQPDRDTLYLNCMNPKCRKRFVYSYSPREIINISDGSVEMLDLIDKISNASPDERLTLFENSRVSKIRRIELGRTKYLVDIGAASAWDYLYQVLPIEKEVADSAKNYPNGVIPDTEPMASMPAILSGIRSIYVPTQSGWAQASKARDMVDIIMSLPPEDASVLDSAILAYRAQYIFTYSLKHIECSHCHTKSADIQIDPATLVFQTRAHQINTQRTVKNFPNF
jgi:hypothetical protein